MATAVATTRNSTTSSATPTRLPHQAPVRHGSRPPGRRRERITTRRAADLRHRHAAAAVTGRGDGRRGRRRWWAGRRRPSRREVFGRPHRRLAVDRAARQLRDLAGLAGGGSRLRGPDESSLDDTSEATLFRRILDEDPLPYSDSLHLEFFTRSTTRTCGTCSTGSIRSSGSRWCSCTWKGSRRPHDPRPWTTRRSALVRDRCPVAWSSDRAGPRTWRQPYLSDGAITD
jgi:hypothetical protein